jgi:hypothetical protein
MKHRFAAAALLILTAPMPAIAASDADILRQAQDRAEISELEWNYVRAIDSLNADAYAQVFTPDGAFGATKGSAALHQMVIDLKKSQADRAAKSGVPQAAMHHIVTNDYVRFIDRDHARMYYYWMTVFAGTPTTQPPRVAAAGRGQDDLVRVGGRWLIQTRNVAPKD